MAQVVMLPAVEGTAGASAQVLAQNQERAYLLIENKSSVDSLIVKFDSVHAGVEGVLVGPLMAWEPAAVPKNSVWIKASAGAPAFTVVEGE